MERFTMVVDGNRQFAAFNEAKRVFLDYLSGEDINNDVGSALDFAFGMGQSA